MYTQTPHKNYYASSSDLDATSDCKHNAGCTLVNQHGYPKMITCSKVCLFFCSFTVFCYKCSYKLYKWPDINGFAWGYFTSINGVTWDPTYIRLVGAHLAGKKRKRSAISELRFHILDIATWHVRSDRTRPIRSPGFQPVVLWQVRSVYIPNNQK